jgi:ABC-2 type transport system ATP-binding protein
MDSHLPLAVEASGLVKIFGGTRAVDGIDLAVPAGSVYGFLGPNGAGKTTAIRMLATLLRPDAGHARVLGHDVVAEADAVRSRVALTGQYASVDEDLTGRENLVLLARLLGYRRPAARSRAGELLDAFGLTEAADRLVHTYSGGMRRRLDIAASIIVTPQLLFLDEPTTGLDPGSRNQLWELIRALAASGATVLLTTQYLDEADQLADRIAVIDHGSLIAEGTPGQLKASIGTGTLHVRLRDPGQRPRAQNTLSHALDVPVHLDPDPEALSARAADPQRAVHALTELAHAGVAVIHQPQRVALSARGRPPRASALSASLAFAWRALLKIKHLPEQLIDVISIPIIFTLGFTYLFGGALAGSTRTYLQFLLPGSLVMTVVLVTTYSGVTLNTDITKGVSDRFRSLPIWRPAPIVGPLIGDTGRYLLASTLVIGLGLALGFRPHGGAAGVTAAVALLLGFAFAVSWIWTTLGLVLRTPSAVSNLSLLVLFPLTLASNVFADPATMPGWLQAFIDVNPISHLVTATRGLMAGTATAGQVGWVLAASAALTAIFAPLTMHLYRGTR